MTYSITAAPIIFAPEAHAPLAHNMHKTKQVHADNFQFCPKPMLAMHNVLTLTPSACLPAVLLGGSDWLERTW
jgi:hypothetical protein